MTYLQELQSTLDTSKEMLELLNNRVAFLSVYSHKSPYQINEDKIALLKTKGEINTLRSIIHEKEKYFEKYAKQHEVEVAEMELNYKKLLDMVNIRKKTDDKLNQLLSRVSMEAVESDIDKKLAFYKTMKSFIAK
jgi:hypothetical protein